jgi:hypothetical protein
VDALLICFCGYYLWWTVECNWQVLGDIGCKTGPAEEEPFGASVALKWQLVVLAVRWMGVKSLLLIVVLPGRM